MKVSKVLLRGLAAGALIASAAVQAAVTVEPITWNVIGLDSNRPDTDGPDTFPVGSRICTDTDISTPHYAGFEWLDAANKTAIYLVDDSAADGLSTITKVEIPSLSAGSC